MDLLVTPQGELRLARYPERPREPRRAWDAADEYVLAHLDEHPVQTPDGSGPLSVVVVNGGSGAVATALALGSGDRPVSVVSWSDSFLDTVATRANVARNGVPDGVVADVDGLGDPGGPFHLAIVKLPKSGALLEEQLARLRPSLAPGAVVVAAGMAKHVRTSTLETFERLLGPTTTSLARKKARLIFVEVDTALTPTAGRWPVTRSEPGIGTVVQHAGVFSQDRLDIGTRCFLDALGPAFDRLPTNVVDLGCGNGVVGLAAMTAVPSARVTFIDESHLAVASAEATVAANDGDMTRARFVVADGLAGPVYGSSERGAVTEGSIDLVLNNPPFHDDHAVSDATAWQMFTESRAALVDGGELWVVGNRHLAYHAKLKRIFGNCDVMASNSKFVVYRSRR